MKRDISLKNVGLAFSLATIIFFAGVFIGANIVERKYGQVTTLISDFQLQTQSVDMQFTLLAEEPCDAIDSAYLVDELTMLTKRLEFLENLYGEDHSEIQTLKRHYSLLQIRHWLLFRRAQAECEEANSDLVIYFYSNERCDECNRQGVTLTTFREKYPQDVKVYAFDMNLNDPAVRTLRDLHGVSRAPSIVFNDELIEGYVGITALDQLYAASEFRNISEMS